MRKFIGGTVFVGLLLLFQEVSNAWVPTGRFYHPGAIEFNLGDICNTTDFPTEGTCSGAAGDPDWEVELQTAMSRWNTAQTNFAFSSNPGAGSAVPGECNTAGQPNSAFFWNDICGTGAFGASTLAVARTLSDPLTGQSVHSDVIFNTAFDWDAYDDALGNHIPAIDIRRVAVHEFGHVLGLNHAFHTLAIMFFAVQDVTEPQPDDIAGAASIYGATIVRTVPDQNGDGVSEVVHVRRSALGSVDAGIWDPVSGQQLAMRSYFVGGFADPDDKVMPVDAIIIPDQDGDGEMELAVLGIRGSNLKPIVEIQNVAGMAAPRRIAYSVGFRAMRVRDLGNADGVGATDLAVMGIRDGDERILVQIRNAIDDNQLRNIYFSAFATPYDMEVIIDPLGILPPRIAVLVFNWFNASPMIELRNGFGMPLTSKLFGKFGGFPEDLEVVTDGVTRLAALETWLADGRPIVEMFNATGPPMKTRLLYRNGFTPLDFHGTSDVDGDGNSELIMMSRRDADGRGVLQIMNTNGSNLRIVNLKQSGQDPVGSTTVIGDVDGDTFLEVAALMSRNSDTRMRADMKNIAGPNTSSYSHVWVTPP